ncbi:MAG TPA: class I SAM-dependent methyltransferase [Edaphobacter sp.]
MADHIINLYERYADEWDADRGRLLIERIWLERFRGVAPPASAILDVGCGSGEPIASYLIEQGHPVTGIDSSPTLIRMCRQRFPAQDWRICDMRQLDLGRTFGGILAWDSFFHLSPADQRNMFKVFRAHATSSTALIFTSGADHSEVFGQYRGEPLYHGSLSAEEYRYLLHENGFEVVSHLAEDPTCGSIRFGLRGSSSRVSLHVTLA